MESFSQDLRFGLRALLKRDRIVSVVAVLTLGLGIGATSAIFSLVNSILLRPLPYENSGKIVSIYERNLSKGLTMPRVSPANFLDLQNLNQVFEQIAAIRFRTFLLTGTGEPEWITGGAVSSNLFALLRVKPIVGRALFTEEEKPSQSNVVVLSYSFWQRSFGSNPNIVGQTLTLDHQHYVVVGIMPRGFEFPKNFDLWVPLSMTPVLTSNRRARFLQVIARLKEGTSLEYAQTQMDTIASQLEQAFPDANAGWGLTLTPLYKETVQNIGQMLLLLLGAVGFVLLIACANVANLLLARAATRQKEIAIRTALGAGRQRLIRQFLTESSLLAVFGGIVGAMLAMWGLRSFVAMAPPDIPRLSEVKIDGQVLAFTTGIILLTGMISGLLPALKSSKASLPYLKEAGQRSTGTSHAHRLLSGFVVFEVALTLILLTGAGLMIRSFIRLQNVDPGFNVANTLTVRLSLPELKYPEANQQRDFFKQLLEQVSALPGIEQSAAITELPIGGANAAFPVAAEGRPRLSPDEQPRAFYNAISKDYFRAMGIPLVEGRSFTERDEGESGPKVVIVDENLARSFWPDKSPIGEHLIILSPKPTSQEVVGVARTVKYHNLESNSVIPAVYVPYLQSPQSRMVLVIRSSSDPIRLTDDVRDEVKRIDKDQPISDVQTMERLLSTALSQKRFYTLLFTFFASVALLLATAGTYAVTSYSVAHRTHEIGIRMALGAQQIDVFKLVIGQNLALITIGTLIGLAGAFVLTRLLTGLLYEVTAMDPLTFLAVPLILVTTALPACYIPARRATKVDPLIALRYE